MGETMTKGSRLMAMGLHEVAVVPEHEVAEAIVAGGRARWNAERVEDGGYVVRLGVAVQFVMESAERDEVENVLVAIALHDRVKRNAMRMAMQKKGDPAYTAHDARCVMEWIGWMVAYGQHLLDSGRTPSEGKVVEAEGGEKVFVAGGGGGEAN